MTKASISLLKRLLLTVPLSLPLPASVTLRQGLVLWFDDTTKKPVVVASETVVATGATPVTVPINPAEEAIAINSLALSWIMYQIEGATNLPIDTDAVTVNNTRLKNGLQGSDSKTRVNLTSAVELLTSKSDKGIWAVILPAVKGSQNIYAVIAKTSGLTAFGQAQLASGSFTGDIEELERATVQFNFQAPFALEYLANDATLFSTEQLADLQLLIEYAGLAGFVA